LQIVRLAICGKQYLLAREIRFSSAVIEPPGLLLQGLTRSQVNVPFTIVHPSYEGNKRCKAVTSHVDIATTLISVAGGDPKSITSLPGKDVSVLLGDPESASTSALRGGALYNFNMFGFIDRDFIGGVDDFLAEGGAPLIYPNKGSNPGPRFPHPGAEHYLC
jgi:hypothetical protein